MEIIVTDRVEVPTENRGKCKSCGKTTKKGLPRIGRFYSTSFGTANGIICYKCYKKIMDDELELLKYMINKHKVFRKQMDKLCKKHQKEILAEEIEDLNNPNKLNKDTF